MQVHQLLALPPWQRQLRAWAEGFDSVSAYEDHLRSLVETLDATVRTGPGEPE